MKITSYAVARPNYYDRNAVSTYQNYNATVAPHAGTTRWTTTVASGKKLLLEQYGLLYYVLTLASVTGNYGSEIYVVGQSLNSIGSATNVVGTTLFSSVTGAVTIYAGEAVYGLTFNYNTGGTVIHLVNFKGTTFDA